MSHSVILFPDTAKVFPAGTNKPQVRQFLMKIFKVIIEQLVNILIGIMAKTKVSIVSIGMGHYGDGGSLL